MKLDKGSHALSLGIDIPAGHSVYMASQRHKGRKAISIGLVEGGATRSEIASRIRQLRREVRELVRKEG